MSFDKPEFLATIAKRAGDRQANIMPLLRAAQAVAPIMEKLATGDANWDRYLQYLQGYVGQARAAKLNAQEKIGNPKAIDPLVLAQLRVDIIVADAMVEAWTVAMQLPNILIRGGEEATATIIRFQENKNEPAGNAQP